MRYRQNTKGDILYGSPVNYSTIQVFNYSTIQVKVGGDPEGGKRVEVDEAEEEKE